MKIIIHSIEDDLVIDSKFITGKTNYDFALKELYPLVDRLEIQRNLQNPSFYSRLRLDLIKGCVMPPITLAIISDKGNLPAKIQDAEKYINENIKNAFILDGIQRLSALHRTYTNPELDQQIDVERPLFLNILICKKMDNLLYRMITLNNGQKAMSANHQIEILLGNMYKFKDLDIVIQTEKEKGKKGKYQHSFEKSNIIKGYLAFLSKSTAIDNKKIIESKMDELVAKKIIDSKITEDTVEFSSVIALINRFAESDYLKKWFDNTNNMIGFCVGIRKSFEKLNNIEIKKIEENLKEFEKAFKALNLSTIKLSKERRNLSQYFIENYAEIGELNEMDLLDKLNEEVL
ncbi:hypothetical protein [Flavobacterium sp. KACC 22761]|uniref:hypothetical protein n=1 Tax=Flavobacterium sp. KACC 22761 TaxID=3092665 RepID=UPI002A75DAB5|nr:hypothetical protein [Flavobacterium sp. KACC 22761]WPO78510.1 hypothetical protein SCB73_19805 [Flavobacterium sp. KACC 22761]